MKIQYELNLQESTLEQNIVKNYCLEPANLGACCGVKKKKKKNYKTTQHFYLSRYFILFALSKVQCQSVCIYIHMHQLSLSLKWVTVFPVLHI